MPFDTRSDKRHPIDVSATFCVHETMSSSVKLNIPAACVTVKLFDISTRGCSFDSPYLIPPNTLVKVDIDCAPFAEELKNDRSQPITAIGEVRSCVMKSVGHYRLGLHFSEIRKEDAEFIDNYIKSKEQRKTPRWNIS